MVAPKVIAPPPAPPPPAPGPATASIGAPLVEARFDAAYLHNPKPPYPAASSRLREEGTVRLRVRPTAARIKSKSGAAPDLPGSTRPRAPPCCALAFRPRTARRRDDRLLGHRPHSFQSGVSAANTEAFALEIAAIGDHDAGRPLWIVSSRIMCYFSHIIN
ncbi:MAG: hypothetical protein LBF50_03660 [Azoarcus sp.]|nr:hypothetical protein [Azoarcus sp.]